MPLKTLFTDAEVASFNGKPVGIAVTDGSGNETGSTSEPCGLDLSQNAAVKELTGLNAPEMFIFASTTNMDAAKSSVPLPGAAASPASRPHLP